MSRRSIQTSGEVSGEASPTLPKLSPRPRRGSPDETRARLVAAAAEVFNQEGYDGTDSNKLARAAGYAPGTFYKHFADKKQLFLAVYDEWVTREWGAVASTLSESGSAHEQALRVVEVFLSHHRRWQRFRASLRALVASDAEIRDFYRAQRRRQLDLLAQLRRGGARKPKSREEDALLLFTLERATDAVAEGETDALGLHQSAFRALLVGLVERRLAG